jgi:parallel beta-helix repeat protein
MIVRNIVKVIIGLLVASAIIGSIFVIARPKAEIEITPSPASFEVSNLVFSPSEVEVGESVVISATVRNVGELSGTYTAELKINGEIRENKNVTVDGQSSQTISFTVVKNTIETCTIEIDGLQRTLGVLKPALKVGKTGYPYSTIQPALNTAQSGDRIKVMDSAVYEGSLEILRDNIILDFNGATILGAGSGTGIIINSRNYATIKNGVIENFGFCMTLNNSNQNTIENMRWQSNTYGIYFSENSNHNTITNCTATNNKQVGIGLNSSSHNTISNNISEYNEVGIDVKNGSCFNVVDNNVASNQKYEFGIQLAGSACNNQITNNTINSNYWFGIIIDSNSDNNLVENNVINLNKGNGIMIFSGSDHNTIQNNTVLYNVAGQINEDETCVGNIILNNTEVGPGQPDEENLVENDAGFGRDATSDFARPDELAPGNYTGYLDNFDIYDCYGIHLNSGQMINVEMTPPVGADFDLLLNDPNRGRLNASYKFDSATESVSSTATSPGYYSFIVRWWQGVGTYSFSLHVS